MIPIEPFPGSPTIDPEPDASNGCQQPRSRLEEAKRLLDSHLEEDIAVPAGLIQNLIELADRPEAPPTRAYAPLSVSPDMAARIPSVNAETGETAQAHQWIVEKLRAAEAGFTEQGVFELRDAIRRLVYSVGFSVAANLTPQAPRSKSTSDLIKMTCDHQLRSVGVKFDGIE